MSVTFCKEFKGDENAEWHYIQDCADIANERRLICMVCGEDVRADDFSTGVSVTCPDCGIYLEVTEGKLVHFTDEKNANCVDEFYGRFK